MLSRDFTEHDPLNGQKWHDHRIPLPDVAHGRSFDVFGGRFAIRWCRHTTLEYWKYKGQIAKALARVVDSQPNPAFSVGSFNLYSTEFAFWSVFDLRSGHYLVNVFLEPRRNAVQLPASRDELTTEGWELRICQNITHSRLYCKIFWEEIGKLKPAAHKRGRSRAYSDAG
jgi:hypothetical protein